MALLWASPWRPALTLAPGRPAAEGRGFCTPGNVGQIQGERD